MLRKIITWGIALFILFYIATQPAAAGAAGHHLVDGVHAVANSMAQFVSSL